MTALSEYQRLEATGLWRETAEGQRREVLVSLGDATLVIATMQETALSHWSLPAVHRLNPGQRPALYAPDEAADEVLELEAQDMIAAIEKLRGVIDKRRPHPGRLRLVIGGALCVAVAALAVFWLPGALLRQTVSVLPDAKRDSLGRDMLAEIVALTGTPCANPAGLAALRQLGNRVLGPDAPRLVVPRNMVPDSLHLPGDIILLNRTLVEHHETPEVVAGHMLAEDIRRSETRPTERLLQDAGLFATLGLLTTGEIDRTHLHDHATSLLGNTASPVPDEALLERFEMREISSQPYAYARDLSGETTLALIEADPMLRRAQEPLLADATWIALQEICGG